MNSKSTNNESPTALKDRLLAALERAAAAETKLAALQIEYDKLASTAPGASESRGSVPDGISASMFRSRLFQMFLSQKFWHAHHVDLVWRYNGEDVREEADWLSDVWYALLRAPTPPAVASGVSRNALRQLVDAVWNAATDSQEVPSTSWADKLIDETMEVIDGATTLARSAAAKGEG